MNNNNFIHLHLHSGYSLLDGAVSIDKLIKKTKEYNMPAIALTDHGVMYGVIEFYKTAKEAGIKPIIGVECYLATRSRFDRDVNLDKSQYHLILLAQNYEGYLNLCQLVSRANLEGLYYKPRIDKELLLTHSKGLIALSACLQGEIAQLILSNQEKTLKESLDFYKSVFKENFYLEIQNHNLSDQQKVNKALLEISKKENIPLVATNDVHYLNDGDAKIHDILLCIQTKAKVNDEKRMRYGSDQFYFKSAQEMYALFKDVPQALQNTLQIAEKCNLVLELGKPQLPKFIPPENKNIDDYLEELALKGLQGLYADNMEEVRNRLQYELKVIKDKGFSAYFLILWDIVNFAKNNNIPVGPGRGSAAGSVVAYALGITSVDPLKYGLFFERFLNPERVSMPDIDIDFCFLKRDEVINYIQQKYGKNYISQIITFGTMKARGVIRDVARALDIPLQEADKVAKLVPFGMNLEESLDLVPEIKLATKKSPEHKLWINAALGLENLPRHYSTHAAGVVISPKSLPENFPMQRGGANDTMLIQYSMDYIGDVGLIKMDILGLRTVTVIQNALDLLKKENIYIDINKIPLNDKKTFQLLQRGETLGIFQLEQQGMRSLVVDVKPICVEDIIALIALYRPGPLQSGMKEKFLENRKSKKISFPHPLLKDVLKETYGIILYQEQVMQIVNILADFTLAQADEFRKGMSKKDTEKIEQLKKPFLEGTAKKQIPQKKAEEIFSLIEKFAGYGFNKSHSAAYALLSYQTAYLKANFPLQFMIALLRSVQEKDIENIAKFVRECEEIKIKVLPPDINKSEEEFIKEEKNIRFGLLAVKNVGKAAIEIIKERKTNGEYQSISDFLCRVDLRLINKKVIESLIKCGALDSLHKNRIQLIAAVEMLIEYGHSAQKNKGSNQTSIFSLLDEEEIQEIKLPEVPSVSAEQLLKMEKEVLGFFSSGHPLTKYKEKIIQKKLLLPQNLYEVKDGDNIKVAGMLSSIKKRLDKKDRAMANIIIEDEKETVEVIVFSSVYVNVSNILSEDSFLVIEGSVDKQEDNQDNDSLDDLSTAMAITKILASDIFLLEDYLAGKISSTFSKDSKDNFINPDNILIQQPKELILNLEGLENQMEVLQQIKNLIESCPGETYVTITVSHDNVLHLGENYKTNISLSFKQKLYSFISSERVSIF